MVRRHIEAWNRRDLTTWLDMLRSDAEIDWSRARGPFGGVYRGYDGLKVFWEVWWSTFEDLQIETHGFAEAGAEVVVSNTAHARGREGIEVTARSTFVFTVENGQITAWRMVQRASRGPRSRRAAGEDRRPWASSGEYGCSSWPCG